MGLGPAGILVACLAVAIVVSALAAMVFTSLVPRQHWPALLELLWPPFWHSGRWCLSGSTDSWRALLLFRSESLKTSSSACGLGGCRVLQRHGISRTSSFVKADRVAWALPRPYRGA